MKVWRFGMREWIAIHVAKGKMKMRVNRNWALWLWACLLQGAVWSAWAGEEQASASLRSVARWQDAEPADLSAAATWKLPGVLRAHYGIEDLRVVFGTRHVRLTQLPAAEGEMFSGAMLFPDDAVRRAELFFHDESRHRKLATVRVQGKPSRWQLVGVRTGMTLAGLVKLNGKPISYSGFDWDYGGTIVDWHGGRLGADLKQLEQSTGGRGLIRLDHATTVQGYPLGEGPFRSDDPRYARLLDRIFVSELNLFWEP